MITCHSEIGSAVVNEKIYVCGKDFDTNTLSVEVFDPSLNQWSSIAPMNRITEYAKLTACNGRLLAVGRRFYRNSSNHVENYYATEIYDPYFNQWRDGISKPHYGPVKAMGIFPFS